MNRNGVRRRIAPTAAALALALAGCGGGSQDGGGGGDSASPGARPASTAHIEIVSPKPGEVIKGDTVTVQVELTGAKLVKRASTDIKPDEGHLHIALDGQTISLLAGLQETIDVDPGTHLLEVEFAASDHGPFDPRVITSVTFTVR